MRFLAALIALIALSLPAQAHRHSHHRHHLNQIDSAQIIVCDRFGCHGSSQAIEREVSYGSDPRPGYWCAWWLRRHMGIPRTAFRPYEYNLARGFLYIGTPATRGCIGCIAVFARGHGGHVGLVEAWDANGNPIILSGNFNGHVDTAPHPKGRLIGLRWWT
jgi:uncharacterized protein (TIGR02594 family)